MARVLADVAAGARFGGPLHLDMGELATNLAPFPSLPFATCGVSPRIAVKEETRSSGASRLTGGIGPTGMGDGVSGTPRSASELLNATG